MTPVDRTRLHEWRRVARLVARRLRREQRHALRALVPDRAIAAYRGKHPVRKLQIGAGPNLIEGWLNTDRDPAGGASYLDAARRFPLPAETFDYVFSEHTIEHLPYRKGLQMLSECYRILRPGGTIRIATPDLERIVSLHTSSPSAIQERFIRYSIDTYMPFADTYRPSFVINNAFRGWGHKFLYDEDTLAAALTSAGFVDCRRYEYGESDDDELRGIERHGWPSNVDVSAFQTLILEATRP